MAELSFSDVSRLLQADFETGKLFWKERSTDLFDDGKQSAIASRNSWNAKNAGKEALTASRNGYKAGNINNRVYYAHRVIWLLAHGQWPAGQVDHINGDETDNRLVNLRSVSHQDNARNAKLRVDNSSGIPGVRWFKQTGKWWASIGVNRKTKHLGFYSDFDEAVSVRKRAERELGFHENHGRDAR